MNLLLSSSMRLTRYSAGFRLLLALLPAICLLSSAQIQAQERPLKKVAISVGSQVLNVTYPWLMLPNALGYWREEGYDVTIVGFSGGQQGLQQMAAGGVTFAQLNSTSLIQANTDNGLAVRGIMGNGVIDWGLATMDGGPITGVQALKGKRIGIVSLATGGVPLLKGLLRHNGIDPDQDVQIIATGAGAPALDVFGPHQSVLGQLG